MADCSQTTVFLAEWHRMCDYYKDVPCEKCPACEYCCYSEGVVDEDILHTVQKWSDENPEKDGDKDG